MKEIPPLRDYQLTNLTFYMVQDRCANPSAPGVGKTPPTCVYSFYRRHNDQARVAPNPASSPS